MKIVQLISSLAEGGAENLVKDYAIELQSRDQDVVVVTTDCRKSGIIYELLKLHDIRIIQLSGNRIQVIRSWIDFLNKYKPDVVHGHLKIGMFMLMCKRNVKLYYTVHSDVKRLMDSWGKSFVLETKFLSKYKKMTIFSLHGNMSKDISKYFDDDYAVFLENCADIDYFSKQRDVESYYQKLGISKGSFIVGHIGRFVEAKNHRRLIDIFEKVLEVKKGAHLILIGVGDLMQQTVRYVEEKNMTEHVHFLGQRSDIPELLQFMNVFVMPSIHEGFPITVIEAQAAGTYSVVSEATPEEAIRSNRIVRLSLENDDLVWRDAVIAMRENEGSKYKLDDCNLKNVVSKLLYYYQN
ncbi:glycosyltransferase [Blautia schinkii]|nr:glycosyltransferase [Blautia schinkii]